MVNYLSIMRRITIFCFLICLGICFQTSGQINSVNPKTAFLTKHDGTQWTNGILTYTFQDSIKPIQEEWFKADIEFPLCDTCLVPSVDCHMCGFWYLINKVDTFSIGQSYQNDFFYEETKKLFYESSDKSVWSVDFRGGYSSNFDSGKIHWIPSDSDSVEIKKIRDLNKPLLDLYKSKKARDRRLAEQDLL